MMQFAPRVANLPRLRSVASFCFKFRLVCLRFFRFGFGLTRVIGKSVYKDDLEKTFQSMACFALQVGMSPILHRNQTTLKQFGAKKARR